MRKVKFPQREHEIKKNATDLDRNAAIRLYPFGSSQGTRIATMHPSRIVLHIENTTDVYAYNSSENLMRAVIADGEAWVPHPLEEFELALDFVKSRTMVDSKLRSIGKGLFEGIGTMVRNPMSASKKPDSLSLKVQNNRLSRKLASAEKEIDRLERQRNQQSGTIADMVALGLLPGGATPPFEMKNRIDLLSWGPDGVHISYTEDRRLRLDFVEGNYTATNRKPQLTWNQRRFVNAVKRGPAEVRVWHHYNGGKRWRWERLA